MVHQDGDLQQQQKHPSLSSLPQHHHHDASSFASFNCEDPLETLDLDDLLSLGSSSSPNAQHPHDPHIPTSPTTAWRLNNPVQNAVHMEIQENAKLPTFNLPVDRSGSSAGLRHHSTEPKREQGQHQQQQQQQQQQQHPPQKITINGSGSSVDSRPAATAIASPVTMSSPPLGSQQAQHPSSPPAIAVGKTRERHSSLGEMFLSNRSSYHANWEQAGILRHATTSPRQSQEYAKTTYQSFAPPVSLAATTLGGGSSQTPSISGTRYTSAASTGNPATDSAASRAAGVSQGSPAEEEKKDSADHAVTETAPPANDTSTADALDALAAQVDPTPLSEIRQRHMQQQARLYSPQQQQQVYPQYYPYMRPYPLPVTTTASTTAVPEAAPPPNTAQQAPPTVAAPASPIRQKAAVASATVGKSPHSTTGAGSGSSSGTASTHTTAAAAAAAAVASTGSHSMADAVATAAALAAATAHTPPPAPALAGNQPSASEGVASVKRPSVSKRTPAPAPVAATLAPAPGPNPSPSPMSSSVDQPYSAAVNAAAYHHAHLHHHHHSHYTPYDRQQHPHHHHHHHRMPPAGVVGPPNAPSIQHASKQRVQYGFGSDHRVPSVPQAPTTHQQKTSGIRKTAPPPSSPPPFRRPIAPVKPAKATTLRARPPGSTSTTPSPTTIRALGGMPQHQNADSGAVQPVDAYERKKQRAKDARVKLNDSIERLSIAINLAGTQSRQRASQWRALPPLLIPPEAIATSAVPGKPSPTTASNLSAALVQLFNDSERTADGAKKWDRPGFVGTAASLIHQLNSQCETLMRHVSFLTVSCNKSANIGSTNGMVPCGGKRSANTGPHGDGHDGKRRRMIQETRWKPNGTIVQGAATTLRAANFFNTLPSHAPADTSPGPGTQQDQTAGATPDNNNIFANHKIVVQIASYLDPKSMTRCLAVCTHWKNAGVFSDGELWGSFLNARFGTYHVRQWRAILEDEDDDDKEASKEEPTDHDKGTSSSLPMISLYLQMDHRNVMPAYLQHNNSEGLVLLGQGRLPGQVSAWTFLVDRSNGETLRSVRRKEDVPGSGIYTSLPVVELRTILQNTGQHPFPVVVREQTFTVDAATRRRGEEWKEIEWDARFQKRILNLDGSNYTECGNRSMGIQLNTTDGPRELCRLNLFQAVVIETFIYAAGCSTTAKFVRRSNFTKTLLQLHPTGTTVPLVIRFSKDTATVQILQ